MASADATQTANGGALLVRWQGLIAPDQAVLKRLESLAGLLLLVLLTGIPLFCLLYTSPSPRDIS